jgi:hypothetical protein
VSKFRRGCQRGANIRWVILGEHFGCAAAPIKKRADKDASANRGYMFSIIHPRNAESNGENGENGANSMSSFSSSPLSSPIVTVDADPMPTITVAARAKRQTILMSIYEWITALSNARRDPRADPAA